jgi:hypothetical protein
MKEQFHLLGHKAMQSDEHVAAKRAFLLFLLPTSGWLLAWLTFRP